MDSPLLFKMQKVIVLGCPGAGKTTFSEKLSAVTHLPLFYLDAIWHKPDKTHITREAFDEKLAEIFRTPSWIIDGNYERTIELRLKYCDTVFLFDLPAAVCLQGASDRLGREGRRDLPWIERELDAEFEAVIRNFSEKSLPKTYELLEKYKAGKEIVIFRSRKEAELYLRELQKTYAPCSSFDSTASQ